MPWVLYVQIYVEIAWQEKKRLQNAQANDLFQIISGSKAIHWNFQCFKCVYKHVKQDDGWKGGVDKQNSKKLSEKNDHACSILWFWITLSQTVHI